MPTIFSTLPAVSSASAAAGWEEARADWLIERLDRSLSDGRLAETLRSFPPGTGGPRGLERLWAVAEPADADGSRGSYAGWIARAALGQAAVRGEEAVVRSLLVFFGRGGTLRELEGIAARVLEPRPAARRDAPLLQRSLAFASPLGSWRLHRWAKLAESDDPLRESKMAELADVWFRLKGDEKPFFSRLEGGESRESAYAADGETRSLVKRVGAAAYLARDAEREELKSRRVRDALRGICAAHPLGEPFRKPQVLRALKRLGDPASLAVADRIGAAYRLHVEPSGVFEAEVKARREREGHRNYADPARQNAIFFGRSVNGEPEIYLRARPLGLPWMLPSEDLLFEVLATLVHEDRHAFDLDRRGGHALAPAEAFPFELRGDAESFLWRARHGDVRDLRRFASDHPLGFGLGYRDYYEIYY